MLVPKRLIVVSNVGTAFLPLPKPFRRFDLPFPSVELPARRSSGRSHSRFVNSKVRNRYSHLRNLFPSVGTSIRRFKIPISGLERAVPNGEIQVFGGQSRIRSVVPSISAASISAAAIRSTLTRRSYEVSGHRA